MSILIPDMKMPKSCAMCKLRKGPRIDMTCFDHSTLEKEYLKSRPEWCPLIELPPHGRLIDADKLGKSIQAQTEIIRKWGIEELTEIADLLEKGFLQEVENAETIIPADPEGGDSDG